MTQNIPFNLGVKNSYTIRIAAGAICFIFLALWPWTYPLLESIPALFRYILIFIMAVGPIGAAYSFVYLRRALRHQNNALTLDNLGVTNHISSLQPMTVPWTEIGYFSIRHLGRTEVIEIYLNDPEGFIQRNPGKVSKGVRQRQKVGYGHLQWPIKVFGMPPQELLHLLKQRHAEVQAVNRPYGAPGIG